MLRGGDTSSPMLLMAQMQRWQRCQSLETCMSYRNPFGQCSVSLSDSGDGDATLCAFELAGRPGWLISGPGVIRPGPMSRMLRTCDAHLLHYRRP